MASSSDLTAEEAAWLAAFEAGRLSGPRVGIGMPEKIRAALIHKGRLAGESPTASNLRTDIATPAREPLFALVPPRMRNPRNEHPVDSTGFATQRAIGVPFSPAVNGVAPDGPRNDSGPGASSGGRTTD